MQDYLKAVILRPYTFFLVVMFFWWLVATSRNPAELVAIMLLSVVLIGLRSAVYFSKD
ncbi:MAG: hypothetical protein ACLFTK_17065 [Anaerolineales bacterium]